MKRRVVCVWLPHLAAERILKHAADRDQPFAVVAEARNALRLCSLNRAAQEAGLRRAWRWLMHPSGVFCAL